MGKIKARSWSIEQKLSIVMSLIQNEASAEELAKRHGVGKSTLYKWRDNFVRHGREGLGTGKGKTRVSELETENQHLKEALAEAVLKLELQKKWFKL
jgi:putative transposase